MNKKAHEKARQWNREMSRAIRLQATVDNLTFSEEDVAGIIRKEALTATLVELAEQTHCNRSSLSLFLNGARPLYPNVAQASGFVREIRYRKLP